MKKISILLFISTTFFTASAQDDLLAMMQTDNNAKATPVYATFKSTRIVNLQSNETMKAKHLDFRIQHRFAPLDLTEQNNFGFYNYFGLDAARIRLGLEYGITDRIMVGLGRSNLNNFYDGFVKAKVIRQTGKGQGSFPLSIVYFANCGITATEWADKTRNNLFTSRLSYVHQLILTRKFNDHVSVALVPSFVHHNLVPDKKTPNDIIALGIGASFKVTRSTRFNIEYIPRLNGRDNPETVDATSGQIRPLYYDAVAFGFDIETGGHVFQLHFTNALGLAEQQVITQTTEPFLMHGNAWPVHTLRFGFNISRTFSFDSK